MFCHLFYGSQCILLPTCVDAVYFYFLFVSIVTYLGYMYIRSTLSVSQAQHILAAVTISYCLQCIVCRRAISSQC